jgi:hypothetical protein
MAGGERGVADGVRVRAIALFSPEADIRRAKGSVISEFHGNYGTATAVIAQW